MKMEKVISEIIHLPRKLIALKDVSAHFLLNESGYREVRNLVSVKLIQQALGAEPLCVEEWLAYSRDKRCGGWYFTSIKGARYAIGCLDEKSGESMQTEYSNPLEACAHFIKKEAEAMLD